MAAIVREGFYMRIYEKSQHLSLTHNLEVYSLPKLLDTYLCIIKLIFYVRLLLKRHAKPLFQKRRERILCLMIIFLSEFYGKKTS